MFIYSHDAIIRVEEICYVVQKGESCIFTLKSGDELNIKCSVDEIRKAIEQSFGNVDSFYRKGKN